METRKRRRFTAEHKSEAVERLAESGKTLQAVAQVFGELPRRRDRLDSCFAGGVAGASPLVVREVWGLAGACRYPLKPQLAADTYYRSGKGQLFHPARGLSLPEHFFLWRHLHGLTLPDLVIAGGKGLRVLQAALRGVDGLVERARR